MSDKPAGKTASLSEINAVLRSEGQSGIKTDNPIQFNRAKLRKIAVPIDDITQTVEHWLDARDLTHCPASGLFRRTTEKDGTIEVINYSVEYVWSQMDIDGCFVEFDGLNQERFLAIMQRKYEELRQCALDDLKQLIAPYGKADMPLAIQLAKQLIRRYCTQSDEKWEEMDSDQRDEAIDREENSALLLVHSLWQVKRKIFGRKARFPMMLTWWSREEGSGKSSFLDALYAPIMPFVDRSTFSIFSDKFGSGQFGQYYILVFPEMSGVGGTNMGRLKEILEQDYFPDRDMYTKTSMQTINRATCSNTSNYPPPHGLKIDGAGRRFGSIHFSELIQTPGSIKSFLTVVQSIALDLWQAIDINCDPVIEERFEEIRAQQRADNRQENIMDEFLEVNCQELDEPATGDLAQELIQFTKRFREFIAAGKYPFRDAITGPNMKKWLTLCGVTVRRHSAAKKSQVVQSHKLIG